MRRILCFFLTAACVLLAAPFAQAQQKADAPLIFRPFRSDHEMVELSPEGDLTFLGPVSDRHRLEGYHAPLKNGPPLFFELRLRGVRESVIGVLCKSSPSAVRPDRLWLDANHDHDFAESERVKSRTVQGGTIFGPIQLVEDAKPLPAFYLVSHPDVGYMIAPTGLREGFVTLGGRKVKVGLVEGVTGRNDVLLIDYNGDGRFQSGGERMWANEAHTLPRRAQMPDGAWYRVQVEEDGSRLVFERDPTPTGKILFPASQLVTALRGADGDSLYVRGTGGSVAVPAGDYEIWGITLMLPDRKGGMWSALLSMSREHEHLQVEPGRPTQLLCGPPFALRLKAGQNYRQQIEAVYQTEKAVEPPEPDPHDMSFEIGLKDRWGNSVTGVRRPDGTAPPEPTGRIVDANGHTLQVSSFEYG